MAICSSCLKDKTTVDRNLFNGMCADCTNKSLSDDNIYKNAEEINKLLKEEL